MVGRASESLEVLGPRSGPGIICIDAETPGLLCSPFATQGPHMGCAIWIDAVLVEAALASCQEARTQSAAARPARKPLAKHAVSR